MKTVRRLLLLVFLGASFASAQTATLSGTVSNTATRSFLEGALVTLAGTTETAFTDRDGSFVLTGIAPGTYTLEVTYTGLDRHTQPIVVNAGRNVAPAIGLRSDVYRLDAFTVSGEREGSAAAITRQRNADNVKSVLATDTFGEIVDGNTGLSPQHADNFDLSAEYYFEPAGILSLGAFRKNIRDFIFTDTRTIGTGSGNGFDGQYAGYLLSTKKNGGTAMAQGLEFSYNQQLGFLHPWLRGLSAYATYTLIDSKGNYNNAGAQPDDQLAQFVPAAWNAGLTYQRRGWTVRAQLNYNARFLSAYAVIPAERIYDDERIDGALNVKYQIRNQLAVYCDWSNALNQTVIRVQGKDYYRPQKIRYNGMRFNFGLSGNF